MSRDSCISHKPKGIFLKLRKDYRQLMGGDNVASALLSVFEYWADGMIATNSQLAKATSIWVGSRSILQFEEMLIGMASDKRIRLGLKKLAAFGYIQIKGKASDGTPRNYCFMVDVVQKDLDGLGQSVDRTSIRKPRSIDRPPSVNEPTPPRSIDRPPSVNEPTPPRSIDQTSISKNSLNEEERRKKEEIDRVTSKKAAASDDAIAHAPETIDIVPEPSEPVSAAPSPRTPTEQAPSARPELSGETTVPSAPKTSKKRKIKHTPDREPEAFQMFWETYYAFCLDVSSSAGVRAAAVQAWDVLLPTIERSDLEEGTAYYIQKKREQFLTKGEAIGVSHCCRFLRDLKWQEALDHKRHVGSQPVMTPGNRRAMQTYQSVMTAIKDL